MQPNGRIARKVTQHRSLLVLGKLIELLVLEDAGARRRSPLSAYDQIVDVDGPADIMNQGATTGPFASANVCEAASAAKSDWERCATNKASDPRS